MLLKLQLAKPAEGKDGAKLVFHMYEMPACPHVLKLHQDAEGMWHPEFEVNFRNCSNKNIDLVREALVEALNEAIRAIQCPEANTIQAMACMVSK